MRLLRRRARLDRLDVAILVDRDVGQQVAEQIRPRRRHLVRRELDDQIGLADLPGIRFGELRRRRHVGRVAAAARRCRPTSTIVAISSSESDGSSLNSWMPMVLSTCHGGISRAADRVLMARAHGRTCS